MNLPRSRLLMQLRQSSSLNWPVHTGNKLLPKTATNCCRFRQQFVAVFGNNLLPFSATKFPFLATICCRKWQQGCQCGQAFTVWSLSLSLVTLTHRLTVTDSHSHHRPHTVPYTVSETYRCLVEPSTTKWLNIHGITASRKEVKNCDFNCFCEE